MTDLITRIADVKKKAEAWRSIKATDPDYWSAWKDYQDIEPELILAMEAEIARLTAQLEKAREFIGDRSCECEGRKCWQDYDDPEEHCPRKHAARVHAELAEKEKENVLS